MGHLRRAGSCSQKAALGWLSVPEAFGCPRSKEMESYGGSGTKSIDRTFWNGAANNLRGSFPQTDKWHLAPIQCAIIVVRARPRPLFPPFFLPHSTVRSGVKEVATFSDIEGLRETILYRLTIYIYYCETFQAMESTIDIFYLFWRRRICEKENVNVSIIFSIPRKIYKNNIYSRGNDLTRLNANSLWKFPRSLDRKRQNNHPGQKASSGHGCNAASWTRERTRFRIVADIRRHFLRAPSTSFRALETMVRRTKEKTKKRRPTWEEGKKEKK